VKQPAARLLLLLAVAIPITGCGGPGRRPPPQEPLEKGLFFEERDDRGRAHAISARKIVEPTADQPPPPVERLAEGATVDVNSTLRIELRRDELGSPSGRLVKTGLLGRAGQLRESLEGFAGLVEAEARATEAWRAFGATNAEGAARADEAGLADDRKRAVAYRRFAEEKRAHAEALERFLGPLRDLWPRDDAKREEVEEIVDALLSTRAGRAEAQVRARARLGVLLQEKVDQLSADLERLEAEALAVAKSRMLRIEGFVLPAADGEDAHPVHVEGYDAIDEKRVETIDRMGVRLTESERRYLIEASEATREIAAALERVRQGEATLSEALAGARTSYARALEERAAAFEALAGELSSSALSARAGRTRTALDAFLREARTSAEAWAREREQAIGASMQALIARSEALATLVRSIEEARALRDRWRAVAGGAGGTGADLPALVFDTAAAAEQLTGALRRLELDDLEQDLAAAVRTEVESAPAELREILTASARTSGLEGEITGWKELAGRTRETLRSLADVLAGAPPVSVPTDLVNPKAFDVPLDMAPDAEIRLQTTTRRAGDRLLVQAKLLERASADAASPTGMGEPKVIESSATTLRLEKLDWHADLVPSVVIVAADQLAGADDVAGFSAALSWVWSYGPRDDEDDPYLSRSLDWSAGLHAVFLNFGPDNDPEIGLGVTVGLWDGKIQFGMGYNPFAEEAEDGRVYYFIGSSLVPLLQALSPGE